MKKLLVVVLLVAHPIFACGPEDPTAALFLPSRPDAPIDLYVAGRLGVIRPTYARSHLVVAYRWLSGNPPAGATLRGMRELVRHRLREYPAGWNGRASMDRWQKVRSTVTPPMGYLDPYQRGSGYSWRVNCHDDAFEVAAATLEARIKTFGAGHRGVKSWVAAQDVVFANCSESKGRPAPAELDLPPVFHYDRAYQLAAADFYAARYDAARTRFLAIGRDRASPWRRLARYLAVRTELRRSPIYSVSVQFTGAPVHLPSTDPPAAAIENELRALLADPDMKPMREPVGQLLRFVTYRTNPYLRLQVAAAALASKDRYSAARVRDDLEHYTFLLDRGDFQPRDPMTDWIRTFQDPEQRGYAVQRWRAMRSTPWLVAALTHARPKDAAVGDLLAAAGGIDSDSPAYPTVAYHRARLLTALERTGEARDVLDRVLALDLPSSARNALGTLRLPLAQSIDEFLRDVAQKPVGEGFTEHAPWEGVKDVIPPEAAVVFNRALPLDMLVTAARDTSLPRSVRNQLAVTAWTRAVLLRRDDVAEELVDAVAKAYPVLKEPLARWRKTSGARRRFATVDLMIHFPGLSPWVEPLDGRLTEEGDEWKMVVTFHGFKMNWWCRGDSHWEAHTWHPQTELAVPPFAKTKEIRERVAAERNKLLAHNGAAAYMLRGATEWAKARPRDERVAEALSMVIKDTRWTCRDDSTRRAASIAFATLQRLYPDTKWAKETPYWYDGGQ